MICDHIGYRVFTRRVFSNKSIHFCVQCLNCGAVVKHEGKLFLKESDIPSGVKIKEFNIELNEKGLLDQ